MEEAIQFRRNVLWWGADQAEYGWLKRRITGFRSSLTAQLQLITVDVPVDGHVEQIGRCIEAQQIDRVIVACHNRWDYPHQQLQQLALSFPEVPIALAVGDWWLGWRRTGVGHLQNLPHVSLPWYRWWDGWIQWLDGSVPTMFGPFPLERMAKVIQQAGPVWDDSRLATWLGWERSLDLAIEELVELQARNPQTKLWIEWTLPTWEVVSRLDRAGLDYELLAKPHLASLSSAALART